MAQRHVHDHDSGDGLIPVDEALDRQAHLLLGDAAHFEQPRLELFELVLKVARVFRGGHQPNLPVT